MNKQIWVCKECKKRGEVIIESGEGDVMSVFHKIEDGHKSVSRDCLNNVSELSVINEELIGKSELDAIMALPTT